MTQLTITGLGERAESAPLEDTVMALKCMSGIDVGIKMERFCEVSRMVLEKAKVTIPGNRPIVGDVLHQIESGIVAGFFCKAREHHPLQYVLFTPELVGRWSVDAVLDNSSDMPSMGE